jgi:hypothetical protein
VSRPLSSALGRLLAPVVCLAATVAAPALARAQAPGLPVLQDAFYSRGFAVGLNAAGGGGSTVAAAVSYSPLAGTLQLVAGAGSMRASGSSATTYGGRISYRFRSFGAERQIATAIFVGAGRATRSDTTVGRAPVGLSVGYRRALGETRTLALYAAPYYDATRVSVKGQTKSVKGARFRSGVGVDVALTESIGAGLGVDVGGTGETGTLLPAGTQFGAGISYRF